MPKFDDCARFTTRHLLFTFFYITLAITSLYGRIYIYMSDVYISVCIYVFVKKAQKAAQLPSLPSLTALGKTVPAVPYTHILPPPVTFDKGNNVSLTLTV